MASSRSIAAVDLSFNCGAAITSDDCKRSLISAASEVTQFFPACDDGSGRPFRVTIGLPHPLAQRAGIGCKYLPGSQNATEEHDGILGIACGHLAAQVLKRAGRTVGVVSADNPSIEASDRVIRIARREYGMSCKLIPWPIAAAWSWLQTYAQSPLIQSRQGPIKIVVSKTQGRHCKHVLVHLIVDEESKELVPLRDYEADNVKTVDIELESTAAEQWARQLGNIAGTVSTGLSAARSAEELHDWTGAELQVVEAEHPERKPILATGALEAMQLMACGRIPYYVSAPKIELLATKKTFAVGFRGATVPTDLPYWVDCLRGQRSLIDGHYVIPANRTIRWNSGPSDFLGEPVTISTGVPVPLQVAFNGDDVRQVTVTIPHTRFGKTPATYGCEYVVGSGRPTVVVEARDLGASFKVKWSDNEDSTTARDDLTAHAEGDELKLELELRAYYNYWHKYHHFKQGRRPPALPIGFRDWRRDFTRDNPCAADCPFCT